MCKRVESGDCSPENDLSLIENHDRAVSEGVKEHEGGATIGEYVEAVLGIGEAGRESDDDTIQVPLDGIKLPTQDCRRFRRVFDVLGGKVLQSPPHNSNQHDVRRHGSFRRRSKRKLLQRAGLDVDTLGEIVL